MNNHLAARIREARIKANLSQNQLAKLAGIAQSALHSLESGKTKMTTRLSELARALNISVEWLLDGETNRHTALAEPAAADYWTETYGGGDSNIPGKFIQDEIPILGTTAAENGQFLTIGQQIATTIRHPMQIGVKGACALHMVGDAMYPRYTDGELVYCVKTLSPVANQDVVIIRTDGLAMVRRLIKINYTEQKLTYQQFNPLGTVDLATADVQEIWPIVGRR